MTEQLKQAERALDRMSGYLPRIYKDDIEIVRRALTTSQPAQAGEVDERVAFEAWKRTMLSGFDAWDAWQARASLPTQPAAQATPEPVGGQPGQAFYKAHSFAFDHRFPWESLDASVKNRYAFAESMLAKAYATPQPATPTQQAAGEPVLYVSQKQAESIRTTKREWYTPEGTHGRYLPVRAEPSGLFTMPLYAAHPAPGVPEGFAMVPYPPEGHGYVLVRVDTGIKDGWCFCTPKNHPEDVARGLTDSEYDDSAQFFGNVLAAAQAKGGEHG